VSYGSWHSPLGVADVAAGQVLLDWVEFVGSEVWWVASRPREGGRNSLVRRGSDGVVTDVLSPEWDVRSPVMGYGGRPWTATSTGAAVFSNWSDERVYLWRPDGRVVALSPVPAAGERQRFCDFTVYRDEVWCLRETLDGGTRRDLVALPLDGSGTVRPLAATHHFLTGPRIAPGGRRVAWLGWDPPAMPWHRTDVMVADIDPDGVPGEATALTDGEESVTQVEWRAAGDALLVVSDRTGWWNVHEVAADGRWRALCPREEEFGEALWRIGSSTCAVLRDGGVAVAHGTGPRRLGVIRRDGELVDVDSPYTDWRAVASDGSRLAAVAGGPRHPRSVVLVEGGATTLLWSPPDRYSRYAPVPLVRTYDGVHAHVHPPYSPDFTGPAGELPPYLVFAHGGPTSRSPLVMDPVVTFFTSRGIGVIDVQYGGSSGYGRAYRDRLRQRWGEVDVRDCATAVRGVIAEGWADPDRIGFRGASAGGWTGMCSLVREPDLYRAAAIYFPVLDAALWRAGGTHDFEARYADWLIGPWPQARARYRARSPVAAADRIRTPFLLMQGLRDTICPPEQADGLAEHLAHRAVPFRYLSFPDEGHGFRLADTVADCLRAELSMYADVFEFTVTWEPVPVVARGSTRDTRGDAGRSRTDG
jgi:dipeptidyl aminopeptidase/acylaminoacyl peptidase